MKIGTHTRYQISNGANFIKINKRCFSCGRMIIIVSSRLIQDYYWKGNMYCDGCYIQVSHGIELPKYNPKIHLTPCPIEGCKEKIWRRYEFCYTHVQQQPGYNPQTLGKRAKVLREIRDEIRRKPQKESDFVTQKTKGYGKLKEGISFCQNVSCPDRKPMDRSDMTLLKIVGQPYMYFCSLQCKFEVKGDNPTERYIEKHNDSQ